MKLYLIMVVTLLLSTISCLELPIDTNTTNNKITVNDRFFGGAHKLMSLNTYISNTSNGNLNGGYFVLVGGISANYSDKEEKKASFVWLNKNNEYIFTELPLSSVRFQINDSIKEPYCKFKWTNLCLSCEDESQSNIIYVVLVLRSEHILGKSIELKVN